MTQVDLLHLAGRDERWIRFGQQCSEQIIDRKRRILCFREGALFALVCWQANDYGTTKSTIHIVRAVAAGAPCATLPFVRPGGDILLHIWGWPKVERVFAHLASIEQLGIDPADVAPDHYRHLHNRLRAGFAPRDYSLAQHRAWQLKQRIIT